MADRPVRSARHIPYRPEIDGLRALAVIPVVLFHLGVKPLIGGNLGVDVFFVISGFLITSITKREVEEGSFSFRRFWTRRARRILPAMVAMIVAVAVYSFLFIFAADQIDIGKQCLAALSSVANICFYRTGRDYFGGLAAESPVLHTWSLSVEEQFYLFVPVAIWLIYKLCPRRLLTLILLTSFGSYLLFIYEMHRHPTAAYYLLPTRAWELGAGCTLAVVGTAGIGRWQAVGGLVGLAVIVSAYFSVGKFGLGYMLPVVGAVLVIACGQSGWCYRLLKNSLAVYVGKLSYSLYLWHWPVIALAGLADHRPSLMIILISIIVLTLASYYLIETPFRRSKRLLPPTFAMFGFSVALAGWMGFHPRLYDQTGFDTPVSVVAHYDCNPNADATPTNWPGMQVLPRLAGDHDFAKDGIRIGVGTPKVVVLGDSHACYWASAVQPILDKMSVPASYWTLSGADPFFSVPVTRRDGMLFLPGNQALQYDQARVDRLQEWRPPVVILAARMDSYNLDKVAIDSCIDFLTRVAGTVLLIEQPPVLPIGDRSALQYFIFKGLKARDEQRQYYATTAAEKVDRGRRLMHRLASQHPNCFVIETHDLFDKNDEALVMVGRRTLYMDDDHLVVDGAALASDRLRTAIAEGLARSTTRVAGQQ